MTAVQNIAIRVAFEGGDKAERDMKQLGDSGERAIHKIHDATKPAGEGLKILSGVMAEVHGTFEQFSEHGGAIGRILGEVGPAGFAAAAGVGALIFEMHHAVEAAEEFNQAQRRLEAVLTATGGAVGLSKGELTEFAEEMAHTTLLTAEDAQRIEAVLLTFRHIHGDTFKEATKLTADLSDVFDKDFTSAARALGQALDDPINGLDKLGKVASRLNEAQKDEIRTLAESGKLHEAQAKILDILAGKFGGSAEAQNQGVTGATKHFKESLEELQRAIGQNIEDSKIYEGILDGLTFAVKKLRNEVRPLAQDELTDLNKKMTFLKSARNDTLLFGLVNNPAYTSLQKRRGELEAQIAKEEADKQAARDNAKKEEAQSAADELFSIEKELNKKIREETRTERQKIIDGTDAFRTRIRGKLLPDGSNKASVDKELALADRLQNAELGKLNQQDADKASEKRLQTIKKINDEVLHTKPSFDVARQALDAWKDGLIKDLGGATEENQKYIKLIEQIYTVKLKEIYYKAQLDSDKWADGAARGLRKYADEATNAAKNSERVFTNAASKIEDSLVDMVSKGKFSLKSLGDVVQSIEQDILRSFIRQNITGPIANSLSGALGGSGSGGGGIFSSLFSTIGSWFHDGGVVGSSLVSQRSVPAWMFAGAPRLHSGLMSDEFPAILQRGETVIPKNKRMGGSPNITFNISTPNAQSFMDSQGQIMAKMAGSLQRYKVRNS